MKVSPGKDISPDAPLFSAWPSAAAATLLSTAVCERLPEDTHSDGRRKSDIALRHSGMEREKENE